MTRLTFVIWIFIHIWYVKSFFSCVPLVSNLLVFFPSKKIIYDHLKWTSDLENKLVSLDNTSFIDLVFHVDFKQPKHWIQKKLNFNLSRGSYYLIYHSVTDRRLMNPEIKLHYLKLWRHDYKAFINIYLL